MPDIPEFYQQEEGLKKLATHLRSRNGVKVRSGIEHDKRVEYFKGKRFFECFLDEKHWPQSLPRVTDRDIIIAIADAMIKANIFHRSDKDEHKKGGLRISPKKTFEEAGYYTWIFTGNMMWSNFGTIAVIAVVIIFTLLPIWPGFAKKALWYLSVTFLLFMLGFIFIRFMLFLICWMVGYDFWVFPRLFDESLSFMDSFKPVYTFEKASPGQGYYRIALVIATIAFGAWAMTQPTEFDGFIRAQKGFVDDLYSGKLLADVSHEAKVNIDKTKPRVPNLEDLMKEVEEENTESWLMDDVMDDIVNSGIEEEEDHDVSAEL